MKTLFILFALLFSMSSMAQIVGNQNTANTVTVAGRVIDLSDPNVIVTGSQHNNSLSYNTVTIAESSGTFALAQVPVGKKWTLLAAQAWHNEGSSNGFAIGWGTGTEVDTNDPVGGDVFCGGWTGSASQAPFYLESGDSSSTEVICPMVVPANGYPFTRHQGTGSGVHVTIYFLEEDA